MLDYRLLQEERKIIASEEGKVVFEADIILKDDVAWLDIVSFSEEKQAELDQNESFLKGSFDFLGKILDEVKTFLCEKGVDINHTILGNFADVKKYDLVAQVFDEEYFKKQTQVRLLGKK